MVKQPSSIFENHIMLPCCVAEASSDDFNTISSWSQILQSGTREVFLGIRDVSGMKFTASFFINMSIKANQPKGPPIPVQRPGNLSVDNLFVPKTHQILRNHESPWCQFSPGKTCKIVKRISFGSKPHALKLLLCRRFPPANADSPGDFGTCMYTSSTSMSCFMRFTTRQTHMNIIFSEISTNQKKIDIHPYPEKPATAPLHGLGSHA